MNIFKYKNLNKIFKHPNKVCMTYSEHLKLSLGFSYIFLIGSFKSIVHGIYPDIYISSTSDIVNKLKKKIKENGCK
mgnify:FL=1|tara:strand:+ start:1888 stop:2115 length:228 start_codon:yes stop_codon:yes gene_type:complete